MTKQVRVAPGYSNVPVLGRFYDQGQVFSLTDAQYNSLPAFVRPQLMVVGSTAERTTPATADDPTSSYTDQLISYELIKMGVPSVLVWDGSDYQPSLMKARTDRPRTFIGPQDPSSISGITLAQRDQWINN